MKQTSGPFEVVRFYDPAIDWGDDAADVNQAVADYALHRDSTKLRYFDDAKPMIFVCRRLTRSQRDLVEDIGTAHPRARRLAFQFAVMSVRNYERDGDLITWEPRRRDEGSKFKDELLDDFGGDDVQEVGGVIVAQSFLGKGVPLRCPPLASSQDAFLAVRDQYAAQKKASETRTESK